MRFFFQLTHIWLLILVMMSTTMTSNASELEPADSLPTPRAKEILRQSDAIRNPDVPFATTLILTEYHNAKETDRMVLNVHSKIQETTGQFRSLVKFLAPSRDAGKLMLQNGNEIWFYDPAGKNSIRLSAQQRLMGQASNGDVMTTNFALDYDVTLKGIDNIHDADKQPRSVYHLYMIAKNKDVAYASADFWVEQETYRPVKAKFYSSHDRLMKIAYYRRFEQQLGEIRPTEVLIIDGVNKKSVTRMRMKNYRAVTIPEAWFQRDYLPRFRGN